MFGHWFKRSSESFYRNVFALLTFAALGAALLTHSTTALLAVLIFGTLSRTSVRKGWKNPWFAKHFPWLCRKPQEEVREDGFHG
jgi:hypothetical protein